MDDERKIWEQQQDEPDLWYGRFRVFLRLGIRRSINAARTKGIKKTQENSRTNAGWEWYEAAKEWNWETRARAHDEYVRSEEDRIIAEERDKVMRSGFALQHKRIQLLDRLSRRLLQIEKDDSKMWIPETRTTIMGEDKSVSIEKLTFNHHVYLLIDKYQDSIAKEMGERVKKKDITVTEMPPNVYLTDDDFNPDDDGTEIEDKTEGQDEG